MQHKKQFFKKIPFITVLAMIAYIIAVSGYYISPEYAWLPSLASLGFAWLFLILLLLAMYWVFKKPILAGVILILIVAGWAPARATFSIAQPGGFESVRQPESLRIMQWNCMHLPGSDIGWYKYKEERANVVTFIRETNPDIICLQDFAEIVGPQHHSNIALLRDTLGYQHQYIVNSVIREQPYGTIYGGIAIFSKIPFTDTGSVSFGLREYPEAIVWANVLWQQQPIRIVTTHFRSIQISRPFNDTTPAMPHDREDSAIIVSKNPIAKIIHFQKEHAKQAKTLQSFIKTTGLPVVLAADLNTVPASYVYREAKAGLRDGFLGSTWGMGRSYTWPIANLRIDYLMYSKQLESSQWKCFPVDFFDHFPIIADIEIPSKNNRND